jgi:hypothetical protein
MGKGRAAEEGEAVGRGRRRDQRLKRGQ